MTKEKDKKRGFNRISEKAGVARKALSAGFADVMIKFKNQKQLDKLLADHALYGHHETVKRLLARGANPDTHEAQPLAFAVSRQDLVMMSILFAGGAKANAAYETPLRVAILERKPLMAFELIRHGASVEAALSYTMLTGTLPQVRKIEAFAEEHAKVISRLERQATRRTAPKPPCP